VDDPNAGAYAREPQAEDVARICQALNAQGARYVLIGGFAVIAHGGVRTTKDIDLLIDPRPENVALVKAALGILADNAAAEVLDDEMERYAVVRIADEVVVDLMAKACGVTYDEAIVDAVFITLGEVQIPVASPRTLLRTKDTVRPSDAVDRRFLEWLIREDRGQ
jgi:hypothetical protein